MKLSPEQYVALLEQFSRKVRIYADSVNMSPRLTDAQEICEDQQCMDALLASGRALVNGLALARAEEIGPETLAEVKEKLAL